MSKNYITPVRLGLYSDRAFVICKALMFRAGGINDKQCITRAGDGEVVVNCYNRWWTGLDGDPPAKKQVMRNFGRVIESLMLEELRCMPAEFSTLVKVKYNVTIISDDVETSKELEEWCTVTNTRELIMLHKFFNGDEMTTDDFRELVGVPHDPIKASANELVMTQAKELLVKFDKRCEDSVLEHKKRCQMFDDEMFKEHAANVDKFRTEFAAEMDKLKQVCESEQEFEHLISCVPGFSRRVEDGFENVTVLAHWERY